MVERRVSIVVLPIDEYTGKVPELKNVYIRIPGEKSPIKKPEGYHVFVDVVKRQFNIKVGGRIYRDRVIPIDLDNYDNKTLIETINLTPSKKYSFIPGTTFISGEAGPNVNIYILCNSGFCNPHKISFDYNCENEADDEGSGDSDASDKSDGSDFDSDDFFDSDFDFDDFDSDE